MRVEGMGSIFDQNTLYEFMQFSNNQELKERQKLKEYKNKT